MSNLHFLKKQGFTLIELLIVVTLLALLAIAMGSYFSSNRSRIQTAENASQEIIRLLREARNLAITGSGIPETDPPQIPAGGYGFFFDADANPRRAFLFADEDNNGQYDAGTDTEGGALPEITMPNLLGFILTRTNRTSTEDAKDILDTTLETPIVADFSITFAMNSAAVTYDSSFASAGINDSTQDFDFHIILPDVRQYSLHLNKVSRFFEITNQEL